MRLLNKKSRLQRLLETLNDSLDLPGGHSKFSLPDVVSGSGLRDGLSRDKAVKAGFIAAGVSGLTAASAGISSIRRAGEARDDS
jgi:hypothetical protein